MPREPRNTQGVAAWQRRKNAWEALVPHAPSTERIIVELHPPRAVGAERPPADAAMPSATWISGTLKAWKITNRGDGVTGKVLVRGRTYSVSKELLRERYAPAEAPREAKEGTFRALLETMLDGTPCEVRLDPPRVVGLRWNGIEVPAPRDQQPVAPVPRPVIPLVAHPPALPAIEAPEDGFHNPYAFVRAVCRNDAHPLWGRVTPPSHDRYHCGRLTGDIDLELVAKTPYFSAKPKPRRDDEDRVFDPRTDIPATTLKGAVRTIFEALTNSSFGVFDDADRRVSYRIQDRSSSTDLVAVRIVRDGDMWKAERMMEARVLAYRAARSPKNAHHPYPDLQAEVEKLQDMQEVEFEPAVIPVILVCKKENVNRLRHTPQNVEAFFTGEILTPEQARLFPEEVEKQRGTIAVEGGVCGVKAADGRFFPFRRDGDGQISPTVARNLPRGTCVWFAMTKKIVVRTLRATTPGTNAGKRGYLRKAGNTVTQKRFESVFYPYAQPEYFPLDDEVVAHFEQLIEDTQNVNRGREPQPGTVPSPYLSDPDRRHLREGMLLYAEASSGHVHKLLTVKMGRALQSTTLRQALARLVSKDQPDPETDGPANTPGSLLPDRDGDRLCPASRLFGWVAPRGVALGGGPTAYRGRVRFERANGHRVLVEKLTGRAFGNGKGLPLAVLSSPKPNRASFYLRPIETSRDGQAHIALDWSNAQTTLAGRKLYWHHPRDAGFWNSSGKADPLKHPYRREDDRCDDEQTRIITGWVKPGAIFTTRIRFENLAPEELGALLACLEMPDGCHLRIGGGKPLGFGSFDSRITALRILDIEASYASLAPRVYRTPDEAEIRDWMQRFADSLYDAYREHARPASSDRRRLEDLPFVADLFRILEGPGTMLPIHYPRVTTAADPKLGPHIEWSKGHPNARLPETTSGAALSRDGPNRS